MLPVAGCASGAALLGVTVPAAALPLLVLGGLIVALALSGWFLRRARRRPDGPAGLALLCGATVCAVASTLLMSSPSRVHAAEFEGRVLEAVAVVSSSPTGGADGRLWADADSRSLGLPGRPGAIHVPVRLGVPETEEGIDPGTVIRVRGRAVATDGGERAALVLFVEEPPEILSRGPLIVRMAADVRRALADRASRLPGPGAALLPGLAIGDTRAVPGELEDAMIASGLSHLVAVSGSNCAIVTAAGYGLVVLLRRGRVLRVLGALAALAAFVVLVTAEPSVVRAATMSGLAMLAVLRGRPRAGLSILLLAVSLLLVVDPWLSTSIGFVLSAAATAALLVLAPPLARGLSRWMSSPVALVLAVPLSAQLACAPVIALFATEQSLVSVAANLIAQPAAPVATMLGLLACLALPVPPLADLLAACAWLPSAWIAATAETTASWPGAAVEVPPGPLAALVTAVLGAAVIWILVPHPPNAAVSTPSVVVLAVVIGTGTGLALLGGPVAPMTRPGDWTVAACDVGQGDAVAVRSAGDILLVDTGPDPDALERCLRELGIDRVDLLVLTHFDLDHVGGTEAVIGRVDAVLHGVPADAGDERILAALSGAGAHASAAAAGDSGTLGDASWRVLWPRRDERVFPAGNDTSVVMEVSGPDVPRTLLLGDTSARSQRLMARTQSLRGPYDVVKVAHHGSADQDPDVYRLLSASLSIVSVGAGNDYGHPRAQTLELLHATGTRIARTDLSGLLLVRATPDGLRLWEERPP